MEFLVELLLQLLSPVSWLLAENERRSAEEREVKARQPEGETPAPPPPRRRVTLPESAPAAQYVGPGFIARVGKDGHCQVCGELLTCDVVSCDQCATLHHQDCWTYAGGCSTYACVRRGRRG